MLDRMIKKYASWSALFLRLGVGIIFFVHGVGKLFNIGPTALGISGTANFFVGIGIPVALFFAWVVALVETLGGAALLLGLFTRYAALLLAIDMLTALLVFHLPKGFSILNGGYEFVLLLLLANVSLLLSGAGQKWNLGKKFEK
ncbi:MAG: DoxX family protein [Nanoarchaeota archaeon]|nr:DoxX family protein [Nanoarchaeota archaeon]